MPKISNNRIKLYHQDVEEYADVVIMYNSKDKFYSVFPESFSDIIHHLPEEEMKRLKIEKSWSKNTKGLIIIKSDSEEGCLSDMKKALTGLIDKRIIKREVIMVFYKSDDKYYYHDESYNVKHPQIGMNFGLSYATETSIEDKKVYSMYREREVFGENRIDRREINLYNERVTIIPDTPQNRETLETLYDGFQKLNNKMKELTETPDSLVAFIDSNLKILDH